MAASAPARPPRVALIGNPNTGKTTLFNRLCGARAKTSNFPGTTTSMRIGRFARPGRDAWDVVDLPGLYGMYFDGPEARIVRDVLLGDGGEVTPDALVVIVDATNLARNLILVGELLAGPVPAVVALNMTDLAARRGIRSTRWRCRADWACRSCPWWRRAVTASRRSCPPWKARWGSGSRGRRCRAASRRSPPGRTTRSRPLASRWGTARPMRSPSGWISSSRIR
jgi:signal recognition particle receptor subunit beta